MSTHQLDRRRFRPVGKRVEVRRAAVTCGVIAGVFAVAFGIGHLRRSGEQSVERSPARLSGVSSPVPSTLSSAPAIKLAVLATPPPPKPTKPANTAASVRQAPPAATTPAVTPAPTPEPTPSPTPEPTHTSTPSPHPSVGSGGSGSSGGSGTSFESSG